jgi:ABC-type sugar transport system substrate-binding protein
MDADLVVGVLPKELGNPYFEACAEGAREAARERGFTLRWEGPGSPDAAAQAGFVTRWVRESLPVVAVSVADRRGLSPVLREARQRGVKVLTWDADADPDARDLTVVPAAADGIAEALAFEIGLDGLQARLAGEFPGVQVAAVRTCEDIEERALREAEGLLTAHPNLAVIVGLCSPAVPGVARALRRAGRRGVHLTGLSLPAACRDHIEEGWVDSVVTWNARDLGYLAALAAAALAAGELELGALVLPAGRLGNVMVEGDEVRLGRPHIVTAGNLEAFLT